MYEFYGIQAIEDIEGHFQSFTIIKVQSAEGKCVYI